MQSIKSPYLRAITSATYNGLSLTKASSTRTGTKSTEMWYITNPATGPNTLSVTVTGATDDIKLFASSWSGAMQSSPIDVKASTYGSSWANGDKYNYL